MKVLFYMPFTHGSYSSHLKEWKQNNLPTHTVYGVYGLYKRDELAWGFCPSRIGKKITPVTIIIENIRNLLIILSKYRQFNIVYAPYISGLELFIFLSSIRIFRKPIIIWQHHNVKLRSRTLRGFLYSQLQKGISERIFFDKQNMNDSNHTKQYEPEKACVLPWGPDLKYYNKITLIADNIERKIEHITFISTGRDSRDFDTLINAFCKTTFTLNIYINDLKIADQYNGISKNISINVVTPSTDTTNNIMTEMALSDVIVICCRERKMSTGLTSMCDALGLGKAVIITRNDYIDFDVEEIGMGIVVDENDEDGWVKAINKLNSDPELVKQMGKKAKEFASKNLNLELFDKKLQELLEEHVGDIPK